MWLRLHAFLALLLGALVVGVLTPSGRLEEYELDRARIPIRSLDAELGQVTLGVGRTNATRQGMPLAVLRRNAGSGRLDDVGELRVTGHELRPANRPAGDGSAAKKPTQVTLAEIAPESSISTLLPTDWVVSVSALASARATVGSSVGERIADAFGSTSGKIAILIAMASIIGKCMLDSGAADRVVRTLIGAVGEKASPIAFYLGSFTLGIPVFFDTVFYLMIPLGKAMRLRTGKNYLLYVLATICGGTMAHSLVPPTPGPLFVAEALNVDLGVMIIAGCCVGLITSGSALAMAFVYNRIWELPLRESPEMSLADMQKLADTDESQLPPFWLSILPVVLPVVLIAGLTIAERYENIPAGWMSLLQAVGNKNIALVLSAAVAMLTLVLQKHSDLHKLANAVQASLASGGVIILITSAGGAFGTALQQTGVSQLIQSFPQSSPAVIITMAWLITAAIRTAQGSATVAMITAVGVLAGFADGGSLGFHQVWLALAIDCGSKPVAWMNDSGFWVITKMSGMTEAEGLRYITPMSILMGVVGLIVTVIGVTILPMTP
mgnify:FL=1